VTVTPTEPPKSATAGPGRPPRPDSVRPRLGSDFNLTGNLKEEIQVEGRDSETVTLKILPERRTRENFKLLVTCDTGRPG
jgi:hypothetical protein